MNAYRLIPGMFGNQTKPSYFGAFDLVYGQLLCGRGSLAKNAGWYNARGEKLGWGDISVEQATSIAKQLERDELFVILSEDTPTTGACGVRYVAGEASYVIGANQLYHVSDYQQGSCSHYACNYGEQRIDFAYITHEQLWEIMEVLSVPDVKVC